jgi:hypothetical protein
MTTYLSDQQRIWNRLKVAAAAALAEHVTMTEAEARLLVDKIVHDEHAGSTPPEAREYFARELQAMVNHGVVDAAI